MADLEVEKTLREIRERVRAEAEVAAGAGEPAQAPALGAGLAAGDAPARAAVGAGGALARLEVNVATAERAGARLPPLVSNRRGWPARLELWVKRLLKRATHWYTWEQVNFNTSVHHALRDTHAALAALDSELATLRRQIHAFEEQFSEELAAGVAALRREQRAFVEDIHREQGALAEGLRGGIDEARERAGHVLEEQRVLFRQLSLEAGERAVACERARRDLETRLAEVQKAVNREA